MEAFEIFLPLSNRFVNDYLNNRLEVEKYFDYDPFQKSAFQKRYEELLTKSYNREELAQFLYEYHKKLNASEKTMENIEKLKKPNSVVVIGGQQAGLLTGPLYTIHKIISILALAKEQERLLNVPVIPVFWVAGEDHDFEEINHVYVLNEKRPHKKKILQINGKKTMMSRLAIDQKACRQWMEEVFATYGETEHTKQLLSSLHHQLEQSSTYVEFFERLVMELFGDEGIVLINSGARELRELEKSFFEQMIKQSGPIYQEVVRQQQFLKENGYLHQAIVMKKNSSNLFYEVDEERHLLIEEEKGQYFIPGINLRLSLHEIVAEIQTAPWKFSNNVVTRPIMQECLFPTLAFIAGPGEIAYWAELKRAFHLFSMNVPPVVPRLNITFLERNIESDLKELKLSIEDVLFKGLELVKEEWLGKKEPFDVSEIIFKAKEEIEQIHRNLRQKVLELDPSLAPLLRKNAHFIEKQIDFVEKAVHQRIHEKYEAELNKILRIGLSLKPEDQLQERVWNIYYYLNKYGFDFLQELKQLTYHFNGRHKIVKI